jgi:sec-independent protein translocase protein TatB
MLFDIGWPELLLIGAIALVVIGPKDLPRALRVAGFWVRKARTMSREFQGNIEQMIRDAELDDMRRELQQATQIDIEHEIRNTIDPGASLAESLKPPELPDYFDPTLPGLEASAADPAAAATPAAEIVGFEPASLEQAPDPAAEPELPLSAPPADPPGPSQP